MNSKFSRSTICVLFLICGLPLYGQRAGHAARTIPPECSGDPGMPPRMVPVCKPVLPGSQQLPNELRRDDDNASYASFDVPGALRLYPTSINDPGAVTGEYVDSTFNYHGFLRDSHGNISNIDIPGGGGGTFPVAINANGTVTGSWCTADFVYCPGFLRDRTGNITNFDAPGDVNGTNPIAINARGSVTGCYFDSGFNQHGFLRTPDGAITEFDAPGASSTCAYSINPGDAVAGTYSDASGEHYFVRTRNGTLIPFDIPGGMGGFDGGFYGIGQVVSINPEGAVIGSYFQPIPGNPFGGNWQGFLRHLDGSIDTFIAADYPPCCIWTFTLAINPDETITGFENDGFSNNHGFIRTRDGDITLFEEPDAGTGYDQGTVPLSMNNGRVITGFYVDSTGANHGFVRIPH
jgi:hypothetical protein